MKNLPQIIRIKSTNYTYLSITYYFLPLRFSPQIALYSNFNRSIYEMLNSYSTYTYVLLFN